MPSKNSSLRHRAGGGSNGTLSNHSNSNSGHNSSNHNNHSYNNNSHNRKGKSSPSSPVSSSLSSSSLSSTKPSTTVHHHHHHHHQLTDKEKDEIQTLVLWRSPFRTIYYFLHQTIELIKQLTKWIFQHTKLCLSVTLLLSMFTLLFHVEGSHQPTVQYLYKRLAWCIYWCGLGILSSVGLGTGLHTFILYLGPHIASVTLAAYECNSLNFPEPPYPDEILCPSTSGIDGGINVWSIMSKVRLEAFMWGAGTALGELPPYFISRAHRLAGDSQDDDIMEELEELEELVPDLDPNSPSSNNGARQSATSTASSRAPRNHSFAQRVKANMIFFMKRMGFFGILACASIPNPLFDLAGIICGYSLISFWTFFGATLVGKAVIKMHIQKLVVIIVFNEAYVQRVLEACKNIPYIGQHIHDPLREYLQQQKSSLHRGANQAIQAKGTSWIAFCFELFVILMVSYFLVSIINSMAQSNLKQRLQHKNDKSPSSSSSSKSSKKNGKISGPKTGESAATNTNSTATTTTTGSSSGNNNKKQQKKD